MTLFSATQMATIRGKKRQEYIEKWLRGEEDPEIEVIPTKNEGKYIVRPREQKEPEQVLPPATSASQPQQPQVSDKRLDDSSSYYSEYEEEEEKQEPVIKRSKSKRINQNDIQLEILHQLRLLGEETIRKREKKERKKEMKHVVRKEMARHQVYESDSDSEEDVPPPIIYQRPVYKRRTLNLLSDYR